MALPPEKGISTVKTVASIAALGLLFGVLYYLFIDTYYSRVIQFKFNDMASASTIPEDLKGASYLLAPANGGGVYANGDLSYVDYEADGSLVLDMAVSSGTEGKLVYNPASEIYEVRANGQALLASNQFKKHLFLSEDGTRMSVAVSDYPYASMNSEEWSTTILNFVTGETWEINGFAAPFRDAKNVYAFRSDGVYLVDYEAGSEQLDLAIATEYIHKSIAQDNGRTKLAWVTMGNEGRVYDLVEDGTPPFVQVFSKMGVIGTIALTDKNLYEIVSKNNGSTIVRHSIYGDDSEPVRSLPSILSLSKLLP